MKENTHGLGHEGFGQGPIKRLRVCLGNGGPPHPLGRGALELEVGPPCTAANAVPPVASFAEAGQLVGMEVANQKTSSLTPPSPELAEI